MSCVPNVPCCFGEEDSQTLVPSRAADQAKPIGFHDPLIATQGVVEAKPNPVFANGTKLGGVRKQIEELPPAKDESYVPAPSAQEEAHEQDISPSPSPPAESEEISEKERLQEQVNVFSRQALKGCPCSLVVSVGEGPSQALRCTYKIDKSFAVLSIFERQSGQEQVKMKITSIQDIYSLADDGESVFPERVLRAVDERSRPLLLMIVFSEDAPTRSNGRDSPPDEVVSKCYIIEESVADRDRFLDCLKVLCIYANTSPRHVTAQQ